MGRTIDPMAGGQKGAARRPLLRPSVSMSLRVVIPWRVALEQSSPPLHQPGTILNKERCFEKEILLNHLCPTKNCLNGGVHPTAMLRHGPQCSSKRVFIFSRMQGEGTEMGNLERKKH